MNKLSAFGHSFQIKVLYALLNDRTFLNNIADVLTSEYFEAPAHKWIVDFSIKYHTQYHTHPTMEVLKVELKKEKNEVLQVSIKEELKQAYSSTQDDIEYVKTEFFKFCKFQRIKEALLSSVELLEAGEDEDIVKLMTNAINAGEVKDTGTLYSRDTETRYREEETKKYKFPWEKINEITDGGMEEGNVIIIMAGHGGGKSTVACQIALHVAKQGGNVVYYTLELGENYIGKKMDNLLTHIPMRELKKNRTLIEQANAELQGQIIIKHYYPGRSSLDTIESHLRNLKNTEGITPDLIVIDYPELLKARKTRKDINEEANDIYTDIKGLAGEIKTRVVCPSQLNRAGMKEDVVESGGTSGTITKIFIADMTISISRKRKDKLAKTARWHILKSRLGEDGMTYNALMDLSHGHIDVLEEYKEEDELGIETVSDDARERIKKKFMNITPA